MKKEMLKNLKMPSSEKGMDDDLLGMDDDLLEEDAAYDAEEGMDDEELDFEEVSPLADIEDEALLEEVKKRGLSLGEEGEIEDEMEDAAEEIDLED